MLSGAVVGVISVELKDTAVAAGFGTALLGAGATLLPAGASASANAQLHNALTQLAILAAPPEGLMAPSRPRSASHSRRCRPLRSRSRWFHQLPRRRSHH